MIDILKVRYLDLQLEIHRSQLVIKVESFGEMSVLEIDLRTADTSLVFKAIRPNEDRSENKGRKTNR